MDPTGSYSSVIGGTKALYTGFTRTIRPVGISTSGPSKPFSVQKIVRAGDRDPDDTAKVSRRNLYVGVTSPGSLVSGTADTHVTVTRPG